jgi:DNA-directed RNA polymerase specialized sigma24 family protein
MQQVFDVDTITPRTRPTPGLGAATLRPSSFAPAAPVRETRAWAYLKEADRSVLELAERGMSHRMIGQLIGITAGSVSRKLAMVKTRLASPLARCALDPNTPLRPEERETAVQHAVTGLSLREIARARRLPLNVVTDQLRFAQGVARASLTRRF